MHRKIIGKELRETYFKKKDTDQAEINANMDTIHPSKIIQVRFQQKLHHWQIFTLNVLTTLIILTFYSSNILLLY